MRHPWRLTLLVLGGLALVAYLWPLVLGQTFCLHDHVTFWIPSRTYLGRTLAAGHLPEWWDAVGLGEAFAANPLHGVTYPPAWIVAILPPAYGADLLLVGHLLLLGVGTAWFSRRLGAGTPGGIFAGAVLMTSGFAAAVVVNGLPLLSMAWTPWVAAAADRLAASSARDESSRARGRATIGLTLILAAQILSGDPAITLSSMLLAFLVLLTRSPRRKVAVGTAAAAVAGALACSAFGILPALATLAESQRAGGIDPATAGIWSLHPLRLLEVVWPHALGDPVDGRLDLARVLAHSGGADLGPAWASDLYISLPVLVFAVFALAGAARSVRLLALGVPFFLFVALGRYTPIYAAYRWLVLPERLVRYPEKHIFGALVIVAALAGIGFERVFTPGRARRALVVLAGLGVTLGAAVAALAVFSAPLVSALATSADTLRPRLDTDAAVHDALAGGIAGLAVVVLVGLAILLRRHGRLGKIAAPLAAIIVVGHLAIQGWSLQPLVPRAEVTRSPAILAGLPAATPDQPIRLYRPRQLLPHADGDSVADAVLAQHDSAIENTGASFGVSYVPGYDPALSARLRAVWDAAAGDGRRFLALYGIRYLVLPASEAAHAGLTILGTTPAGDLALAMAAAPRPRAFVATRWRWLADDDSVRDALFGHAEAPALAEIRLAGAGTDLLEGPPAPAPCTVREPEPESVDVTCDAPAPAYAVLVDAWAPGWTATVDGAPAKIERADALVRAVAIGAGTHVVSFRYRAPNLRLGALISFVGLVVLGMLRWLLRREPLLSPPSACSR